MVIKKSVKIDFWRMCLWFKIGVDCLIDVGKQPWIEILKRKNARFKW